MIMGDALKELASPFKFTEKYSTHPMENALT
jgi:hypothetical protein